MAKKSADQIEFVKSDKVIKLNDFLTFLIFACKHPKLEARLYTAQPGSKYIKIVESGNDGYSTSVYCFLDYEGNIYKAASWKIPAKHIRGSIFDPNYSFGRGLTQYGGAYL